MNLFVRNVKFVINIITYNCKYHLSGNASPHYCPTWTLFLLFCHIHVVTAHIITMFWPDNYVTSLGINFMWNGNFKDRKKFYAKIRFLYPSFLIFVPAVNWIKLMNNELYEELFCVSQQWQLHYINERPCINLTISRIYIYIFTCVTTTRRKGFEMTSANFKRPILNIYLDL